MNITQIIYIIIIIIILSILSYVIYIISSSKNENFTVEKKDKIVIKNKTVTTSTSTSNMYCIGNAGISTLIDSLTKNPNVYTSNDTLDFSTQSIDDTSAGNLSLWAFFASTAYLTNTLSISSLQSLIQDELKTVDITVISLISYSYTDNSSSTEVTKNIGYAMYNRATDSFTICFSGSLDTDIVNLGQPLDDILNCTSTITLGGDKKFLISNYFYNIYYNLGIQQTITNILNSSSQLGVTSSNYNFIGHGLGGGIAQIAAIDLFATYCDYSPLPSPKKINGIFFSSPTVFEDSQWQFYLTENRHYINSVCSFMAIGCYYTGTYQDTREYILNNISVDFLYAAGSFSDYSNCMIVDPVNQFIFYSDPEYGGLQTYEQIHKLSNLITILQYSPKINGTSTGVQYTTMKKLGIYPGETKNVSMFSYSNDLLVGLNNYNSVYFSIVMAIQEEAQIAYQDINDGLGIYVNTDYNWLAPPSPSMHKYALKRFETVQTAIANTDLIFRLDINELCIDIIDDFNKSSNIIYGIIVVSPTPTTEDIRRDYIAAIPIETSTTLVHAAMISKIIYASRADNILWLTSESTQRAEYQRDILAYNIGTVTIDQLIYTGQYELREGEAKNDCISICGIFSSTTPNTDNYIIAWRGSKMSQLQQQAVQGFFNSWQEMKVTTLMNNINNTLVIGSVITRCTSYVFDMLSIPLDGYTGYTNSQGDWTGFWPKDSPYTYLSAIEQVLMKISSYLALAAGRAINILEVGHSLGGGLAACSRSIIAQVFDVQINNGLLIYKSVVYAPAGHLHKEMHVSLYNSIPAYKLCVDNSIGISAGTTELLADFVTEACVVNTNGTRMGTCGVHLQIQFETVLPGFNMGSSMPNFANFGLLHTDESLLTTQLKPREGFQDIFGVLPTSGKTYETLFSSPGAAAVAVKSTISSATSIAINCIGWPSSFFTPSELITNAIQLQVENIASEDEPLSSTYKLNKFKKKIPIDVTIDNPDRLLALDIDTFCNSIYAQFTTNPPLFEFGIYTDISFIRSEEENTIKTFASASIQEAELQCILNGAMLSKIVYSTRDNSVILYKTEGQQKLAYQRLLDHHNITTISVNKLIYTDNVIGNDVNAICCIFSSTTNANNYIISWRGSEEVQLKPQMVQTLTVDWHNIFVTSKMHEINNSLVLGSIITVTTEYCAKLITQNYTGTADFWNSNPDFAPLSPIDQVLTTINDYLAAGSPINILEVGHSLGGGLAACSRSIIAQVFAVQINNRLLKYRSVVYAPAGHLNRIKHGELYTSIPAYKLCVDKSIGISAGTKDGVTDLVTECCVVSMDSARTRMGTCGVHLQIQLLTDYPTWQSAVDKIPLAQNFLYLHINSALLTEYITKHRRPDGSITVNGVIPTNGYILDNIYTKTETVSGFFASVLPSFFG